MSEPILMACGHTANGYLVKDGKEIPCCVICECTTPAEKSDLTGRKAQCRYCGKTVDSNYGLAFFSYNPSAPYDSYYCGCKGWD